MKYSLSICLIVFAFIITVVSCSPKPPVKPAPAPAKATSANVAPALENQVLDLVNKYRESKKLPPLIANMAIEYEARRHSMDMAIKKVPFSHNGFTNRTRNISRKVQGLSTFDENVAAGNMTAQAAVEDWLKSTEHRRNIEGNYRFTGIGVARNQQNQLYFTQIFAR